MEQPNCGRGKHQIPRSWRNWLKGERAKRTTAPIHREGTKNTIERVLGKTATGEKGKTKRGLETKAESELREERWEGAIQGLAGRATLKGASKER